MMELGEFDRALAYAPAVSLDYWKVCMQKYGEWLNRHEERFAEAPLPYIAINEIDTAVDILTQNEEYEDSKLVRALKVAGVYQDVFGKYEEVKHSNDVPIHHQALKSKTDLNKDEQLVDLTRRQAEQYFKSGQVILSACSFLSINDYKNALIQLVRANELFLAYVLAYFLYRDGVKDVIIRLAYRAERNLLVDEAKQLLDMLNEEGAYYKSLMLFRLSMQGLHTSEGFEEEKINSAAMEQVSFESRKVMQEIFSHSIESACELCCQYFEDLLENEDFDKLGKCIQMFEIIQQIQISKVTIALKSRVF